MKIVHIAPNAPYNEGWGYQDNLLPKYQRKLGHDVTLIITNTAHRDGKIVEVPLEDYCLPDGVRVIRLGKKKRVCSTLTTICAKMETYPLLQELKPDLIFFHGLVSTTIFDAVKYKRKVCPSCVIVQDSHIDGYNFGCENKFKRRILQVIYRNIHRQAAPWIEKVYGVTPWRKSFATEFFGVSAEKADVLIMGADDEKINLKEKDLIRKRIRSEYGIEETDFLVVTGGKIDKEKKIDLLMEAANETEGVKLLVFGNVAQQMQSRFESLLSEKVLHIGWLAAEKTYDYFLAADLVVFPGAHSVMWEQACACKIPCLFSKWVGMEHVNNGGNSDFVSPVTKETLKEKLTQLRFTPKYFEMKQVAASEKTDIYLYSRVAEKSLECAR